MNILKDSIYLKYSEYVSIFEWRYLNKGRSSNVTLGTVIYKPACSVEFDRGRRILQHVNLIKLTIDTVFNFPHVVLYMWYIYAKSINNS